MKNNTKGNLERISIDSVVLKNQQSVVESKNQHTRSLHLREMGG